MEKLTELNQFSNQENDGIWLMCQGYRCESGILPICRTLEIKSMSVYFPLIYVLYVLYLNLLILIFLLFLYNLYIGF